MKLNSPDLNKMATFCQIMESGNYQRASEALSVTPSALSQTVTSLEASLGFLLFDRVGKKLIPTQRGIRLHKEFRTYQSSFMQSLEDITGRKDDVTGMLRIGAYLEFAKSQLTPLIRDFTQRHPDTQIKMVFDTPTRLHALLAQGRLDLCFSIYPSHETKMIRSESVFQQELVLIAPRSSLPEAPTFAQVMAMPMVEYYFNHQPVRRWLTLHYQKRPKRLPVRIFAATAEMVLSLVRDGAGIGVVPAYLVATPEMQKGLRIIRPTTKKLTDSIWLLEKDATERSLLHKTFRGLLPFGGRKPSSALTLSS